MRKWAANRLDKPQVMAMDTTTRNEYTPETVSPPGATVQDLLDERRMTRTDLAGHTGRSRAFVDRLIHGTEASSSVVCSMKSMCHGILG